MEFRDLRAFIEVVRTQSFSRAAERMNATQSAVSKAVRRLEADFTVPLIDRSSQRNGLTSAGEVVYQRGLKLLSDREALYTEVGEITGLQKGVLKLGLPAIGSNVLFASTFARYRKLHPGIDIRLIEYGSNRLEELLREGEVDLAASLLPVASDDFAWRAIHQEPLVALFSHEHPLSQKDQIRLEDLRDVPFILFDSGFALNRIILRACHGADFDPDITVRSSQIAFIIELAAAGLGVAFLPRVIAEQRASATQAKIAIKPVIGLEDAWQMALLWRRGSFLPHAARAWVDLVLEERASDEFLIAHSHEGQSV